MVKGAMGVKEGGFDFTKAAMGTLGAGGNLFGKGWRTLTHNFAEERKEVDEYYKYEKVFGRKAAHEKFGNRPEVHWYEFHKRWGFPESRLKHTEFNPKSTETVDRQPGVPITPEAKQAGEPPEPPKTDNNGHH